MEISSFINSIQCGNCLNVLPTIPDNSIDLIVTSPPYNVEMKYDLYNDSVPWPQYYSWCGEWLKECYRVLKPDGRLALNHYLSLGNAKTGRTAPLMEINHIASEIGFQHHTVAVWTDRTLSRRTAWGKRLNSYIITDRYVQFCFEIETDPKKSGINAIGIDTGIKALASLSNEQQFGLDTEFLIERIKRCEHGSNGQKQARRAFKQRINEVVQELMTHFKNIDLVVVEQLKNMNYKSKLKRRLSKNMRRSIGTWAYRYWLKRLEQACEINRVSFRSVAPYYTSQTCPSCGHVDRGNRDGQIFRCLKCGHTGNADIVAARNISTRFLTGVYGARYQPYEVKFV